MRERIRRTLGQLTLDSRHEGAWLHTLSLMEYIGARKIGRSAAAHHPSTEVLTHWADETRHAAVFKGLAASVLGQEPTAYVAEAEAKAYFYQLDGALTEWAQTHLNPMGVSGEPEAPRFEEPSSEGDGRHLKRPDRQSERSMQPEDALVSYLLVTTVIERRAMVLYPLYRAATSHLHVKEALSRVIVEEQAHRVDIEERCRSVLRGKADDVFAEPLAIEERLFEPFWSAVERTVAQEPKPFLFIPHGPATPTPTRSTEEKIP